MAPSTGHFARLQAHEPVLDAARLLAHAAQLQPYAEVEMTYLLHTATIAMSGNTTSATPTKAVSDDGALALVLSPPRALGVGGPGTNAEQLLAAGLAAGLRDSLAIAARSQRIELPGTFDIVASVGLNCEPGGETRFLTVDIEVALPTVPPEQAATLLLEVQRCCPYAAMTSAGMRSSFQLR